MDGNWKQRSEACVKIQKKKLRGGGGFGLGGGLGGCEWRSEAFVKIQKKKIWGSGQGGGVGWGGSGLWERKIKKKGGGIGLGGQGGCERRSKVFVKIKKKKIEGGGWVGGGGGVQSGVGMGEVGVPRFGVGGLCGVWGM